MSGAETIAAVATGHARSARAMVRLSGPGVGRVAAEMLEGGPTGRGCGAAVFRLRSETGALPLPVLVARFVAPASYTGLDMLEILLPGNPTLVQRVMAQLLGLPGVRRAEPGEFSAQAYLHGRLSLAQAEAVAGIISAESREQLDAARRVLSGEAGARYTAWAEEIATLLALVEAGIDFSDQEGVTAIATEELAARAGAVLEQMESLCRAQRGSERAGTEVRVVLAGPPNAGKSTLFNTLLGRQRTVVSAMAGTTRDVIAEPLELSGSGGRRAGVVLVDLAGLDEQLAHGADGRAQELAREELRRADVVLWCETMAGCAVATPTSAPRGLQPGLVRPDATVIFVGTKADLPHAGACTDGGEAGAPIRICALDGWNMELLRQAIFEAAWERGQAGATPDLLPRHAEAIAAAAEQLRLLAGALDSAELAAGVLRAALEALGELTGRVERDEIIGRIFATFCVGK